MSATNTVRISFRKGASADDWTSISVSHVHHVSYDKPWIVIVHDSEDTPGQDAVTRFHEDTITHYTESTQETP